MKQYLRKARQSWGAVRWKGWNRLGARHECYLCHRKFRRFQPYRQGWKTLSEFVRQMELVGSDLENFRCPFCQANDRERHLFLYFDRLKLWERLPGAAVLHFAPERNLSRRIKELKPGRYVMGDLFPEDLFGRNAEIQRVDATDIQFPEATFDAVICNHVLEHVPDALRALREFHRVLKPGGFAVLQTPFSNRLQHTIEDPGIDTEALRLAVYGQEDHARLFGRDFLGLIETAGLRLKLCRHTEVATEDEARYFGMNVREDFVLAEKPVSPACGAR